MKKENECYQSPLYAPLSKHFGFYCRECRESLLQTQYGHAFPFICASAGRRARLLNQLRPVELSTHAHRQHIAHFFRRLLRLSN
jgi:hypothetical protein